MIALIVVMLVAQTWLAGAAPTEEGGVIVAAIVDVVSQRLRVAAIALTLAGLLLAAIFTGLRALRGSSARPVSC
jgi:hypothetical protein